MPGKLQEYAGRELRPYLLYEIVAHGECGDEDGDVGGCRRTHELVDVIGNLCVLIDPETTSVGALYDLRKILKWVERDGLPADRFHQGSEEGER